MTAGSFARGVVLAELGVPLRALRMLRFGFRPPRAAGFAYDGDGTLPVVIVALAITAIPEMLVLDLLLAGAPVWRTVSDAVHVYAVLWMLAFAYALRTDVHSADAAGVTLRSLFLAQVRVERANVAAMHAYDGRPPRGAVRLGLGSRRLRIELREAVAVTDFVGRVRMTATVDAGVDRPDALARALHG